jgi:AraC-like DNA-binding protein
MRLASVEETFTPFEPLPSVTSKDDAGRSSRIEQAQIRPGFSVITFDVRYSEAVRETLVGGNQLKFHFKIEGRSIVGDSLGHEAICPKGTLAYLVQPRDSFKFEQHCPSDSERGATFVCDRRFVADLLSGYPTAIPACIDEFVNERDPDFHCPVAPLPAALLQPLQDLLQPPYLGSVRAAMIEAKALEILCHTLNFFAGQNALPLGHRRRDVERVQELCAILQSDPRGHLRISELSRLVCWNDTQMMECFRAITGQTIAGYQQKIRMDHALNLLRTTDGSIAQIAFDAGYEHAGNFATAFKRTFGFSPREARSHD